jgi:hypothetical protein
MSIDCGLKGNFRLAVGIETWSILVSMVRQEA